MTDRVRPYLYYDIAVSICSACYRGVSLAFLLHLIQIPLTFVTSFLSLIFIGISQLVYIIPAIIFYWRDGRRAVVKGLIIAAAITFLLNGSCAVIFFAYLSNHH